MATEKDYSKLTQEEISKLQPEDFKAYMEYVQNLKKDSDEKDELIKSQAEQIKTAEAVKAEVQPTVTHKIDGKDVTLRVNVKKFRVLNKKSGNWEDHDVKSLQNDKTGPDLVKQLLEMDSNVVTRINQKKK